MNPYNRETEFEKFKFFQEFTQHVDNFMLKKYPLFDEKLELKINHLTEITKSLKEEKKDSLEFFKKEINKFLCEDHPGVMSKIVNLTGDLEALYKKLTEQDKRNSEKLKKIFNSQSLCEDVYRLKDEVQSLKKDVDKFTNNLKKIFK